MIEKHYAAHLKDMIDTSLINVRKEKPQVKEPTSPASKAKVDIAPREEDR
jgi:hypothetical protein